MLGDELFGVKDPAVLLDVLFLSLVRIEQRIDAAYSVSGNNDFTDRLMSWDQDTCGQIGVFQRALEFQYGLLKHILKNLYR